MKTNSTTWIFASKVILIPYKKEHVPKYHKWMQNSELQELTASEPLSLDEEYDMQQTWLNDSDKCTFIVLDAEKFNQSQDEIESMVGDVNLFFNEEDKSSAEAEIMIAEAAARGKGLGKQALLMMLFYGVKYLHVNHYTAKIGFNNTKSINMFQGLGFKEESRSDYFKEVTLELPVTECVKTTFMDQSKHYEIKEICSSV